MISKEDKELYFDTCNEVTMALHLHRKAYYDYKEYPPHADDWDIYEADYLEKVEICDVVISCPDCGIDLLEDNISYLSSGVSTVEWVGFGFGGHIDYHDEEVICRDHDWYECGECQRVIEDEDVIGIEQFLFGLCEMPDVFVAEEEDD